MSENAEVAGLRLSWAGRSNRGVVRPQNQDRLLALPGLWVVADGMGGHADGAEAAAAVIRALEPLAGQLPLDPGSLLRGIRDAATAVDGLGSGECGAPGSTATVLALGRDGDEVVWVVANVGDSRTYQRIGGRLNQLTVDHSAVQELVTLGLLDPDQARVDPRRNVITRALGAGMGADVEADTVLTSAAVPTRFLLCSDGLTNEVDDATLAAILGTEPDPQGAVDRLIDAALAAGARDNVTAVVVDTAPVVGPHTTDVDRPTAPGPESGDNAGSADKGDS